MCLSRHHVWCWEEDRRHNGIEARLLKGYHVGSNWSGYLHHGYRCFEGFRRDLFAAYRGQEMAHRRPLVLHRKHNSDVCHHHHASVRPM